MIRTTSSDPAPSPIPGRPESAPEGAGWTVLLVEDEPRIRRIVASNLQALGYSIHLAADGVNALRLAAEIHPDIVLLDLGLPGMDGLTCLKRLREWSQAATIIFSAQNEEAIKIQALDLGADDYMTKPFSIKELLARLRVATRRLSTLRAALQRSVPGAAEAAVYRSPDLEIDFARRSVRVGGSDIHLTPTEYDLLRELAQNAGKVIGQRDLLVRVWGQSYANEHTYLRTFISQLRRKLEPDPAHPRYLLTEPGVGYRFRPADSSIGDI